MVRAWLRGAVANILLVVVLAAAAPSVAAVQGLDNVVALNNQVSQLLSQGKHAEAAPLAQQAAMLAEQLLGKEHPATLASVNNLAALYEAEGRYAEAEPLFRRVLEASERVLGAEAFATLISMNNLASFYRAQGRYAEAEPLFRRAIDACERVLGKEHPFTIASVNRLAGAYLAQGRYAEAEPLLRRALDAGERVLGKEHPNTLSSMTNLATLYLTQGRHAEAEPLFRRAIDTQERVLGKEHPDTLTGVSNLAALYQAQGRYAEAEPLFRNMIEAKERVLGKEHPSTLSSLSNLAALYLAQGRHAEAEPLFRRALDAYERVLGKEHPDTLLGMHNLAATYRAQGRYTEAEPLFRRAIEAKERVLGKEHPGTLLSVGNLAAIYRAQGRYAEAEPLFRRVLEANERVLGEEHPTTLTTINNLAELYYAQHRFAEAEPLYRRALEADERVLGKEHPGTLTIVNNLALLYQTHGRYAEAGLLYSRALEAQERLLGKDHPDTLGSVNNLATLYEAQGRHAEAEPLFRRALEGRERVLGEDHPETLVSAINLAAHYYYQRDWAGAAQLWRRSAAAIAGRVERGVQEAAEVLSGKKKSEAEQMTWQFWGLVKAVYRLVPEGREPDAASSRETFETAQWVQSSEAAASLTQMAARGAKGDPKLAALVRERQDLVTEWQRRDALRNAALGQESAKRNPEAEAENNARLVAIDARVKEIDKELAAKFPDYAALSSPAPLAAEEVQAQLGAGEALVLFLDTEEGMGTPEETFIWVVTKTDIRWLRSALGTKALTREVQALRCGLDAEAWADRSCEELTGQSYTHADREAGKPLPFDHAGAFRLYLALFGQAEDLIKGKQLLIVPSGALTQLPFQVLVTAAPASGDQRSAAWLVRDHALTVLPAVSSLKALRRVLRPSAATKSMIGFGNPLLDGPDSRYANSAKLAKDYKTCAVPALQMVASAYAPHGGLVQFGTRGGFADAALLRSQVPLPETANELCAVARDLHADPGEIYLGARATESQVKRLSETGQLTQYRIVHFATHGALAGQVSRNSEPGLLLTPPAEASEEDDGYLSASEVAGLKLDADWVILSACNTAAGGAQGAEALSGLARAFIYAQARALLVSHWEVNSDATVKLITGAMSRLAANKSMGRAEAMRQSMLALIDKGEPREAHPAFWAPFVVVGEGGAGR